MADIDGVDERIAHQTSDQADDAVGGQHACRRKGIARGRGALDIVHRLDEVVDAEGNRRHQDDADELKAAKDVADRRHGIGEAEARHGSLEPVGCEAAIVEAQ
jgi:hypothetical protein